jgi:DNA invertase Pin-like site-specific DNA recombinase
VSTEAQADRGTIGSQLQLLREHIAAAGDELVGEYVDDGHSGARLDRPGLDALRDAAEAGLVERVWCLSPDRLARAYTCQVLVLDELDRFGITVAFTDSPGLAADDPQSVLLTQVQGVIAEYEKAKIAERYRRGKLFRARAGEIVTWKASYGYRRIARSAATGRAHHEVYETEAAVVRRIFTDRAAGITVREICRRLNADAIPSPTGKPTWGHSTLSRLLRNEAYIGRVYYNRTESVPDRRPTRRTRQVPRDRDEWIPIDCPRIISDELFQAAGRVATDNTKWSPRRAEPGPGCSKAWSNAVFAVWAPTATRCAAATAPGTATTTAATTTPSALAASPAAVPNAISAPTPSMPSCSTTSAPPSPDPTYCWPANKPSP